MRYLIFAFLFVLLTNCGLLDSSNDNSIVAFSAKNDSGIQIFTIDFSSPEISMKQFTNNDFRSTDPIFSHDKKYIIYSGNDDLALDNPTVMIINSNIGKSNRLTFSNGQDAVLVGRPFYYDPYQNRLIIGINGHYIPPFIASYDFQTKTGNNITSGLNASTHAIGILPPDTILSSAILYNESGWEYGVYKVNNDGELCGKLPNPHMKYINHDGIMIYHMGNTRYYHENGLFLFDLLSPELEGRKIAVTNWDGTYFEILTTGDFNDIKPVYGPDQKYIIFERREDGDNNGDSSKLMYIKLSDKSINILIDSDMYPGYSMFSSPAF